MVGATERQKNKSLAEVQMCRDTRIVLQFEVVGRFVKVHEQN